MEEKIRGALDDQNYGTRERAKAALEQFVTLLEGQPDWRRSNRSRMQSLDAIVHGS
jgi:hypothetical protein